MINKNFATTEEYVLTNSPVYVNPNLNPGATTNFSITFDMD
jgi:hypothetical protein